MLWKLWAYSEYWGLLIMVLKQRFLNSSSVNQTVLMGTLPLQSRDGLRSHRMSQNARQETTEPYHVWGP